MPEVDWTPWAPGIRLYDQADWVWMNKEGTTGIRLEGAKYVTFPIEIKRLYGTVQYTVPKWTLRRKFRAQIAHWLWELYNKFEEN